MKSRNLHNEYRPTFVNIDGAEHTLAAGDTWQDVDFSAEVPAIARVGLFVAQPATGGNGNNGVRSNGSSANNSINSGWQAEYRFAGMADFGSSKIVECLGNAGVQSKYRCIGYFV